MIFFSIVYIDETSFPLIGNKYSSQPCLLFSLPENIAVLLGYTMRNLFEIFFNFTLIFQDIYQNV